jgi:hypothetical protein
MKATQPNAGVPTRAVWFYIGSVISVLVIGGTLLTLYFSYYGVWLAIRAGIVWFTGTVIWAGLLHAHTIKSETEKAGKTN